MTSRGRARRWAAVLVAATMTAACASERGIADVRAADPVVIMTGGTQGVYYGYGHALADLLSGTTRLDAVALPSGGSVENALAVATGDAEFGFATADIAAAALAGVYSGGRPLDIEAVTLLYDDVIHLVVAETSDIVELADLRGRRVSLGAPGSGTRVIAQRLLAEAGLDPGDVADSELGIDGSIEAFTAGGIEGFFWSGGLPTSGISTLSSTAAVRLVDLGETLEGMRTSYGPVYRRTVVPPDVYDTRDEISTLAVPNVLLTSPDVDVDTVRAVATVLYEHSGLLERTVEAAARLNRRSGIHTSPVDLHDGALAYFRESAD